MTLLATTLGLSWARVVGPPVDCRALPRDDATLVAELKRGGDDELFAELVERHRERVHRLAASLLGPGRVDEAEDLCQEVFILAYRKLAGFRGECAFSTWLYRLTVNRGIDRRRAFRPGAQVGDEVLRGLPDPERGRDPEATATDGQLHQRVLASVARLPEPQRTVVYLYYWLDRPVAEIALLLDLQRETVKSHLHRARRRLAPDLEEVAPHG